MRKQEAREAFHDNRSEHARRRNRRRVRRAAGPGRRRAAGATPITPQLIEAATKEGKVVFYSAIDLKVTQGLAKAFEQKYPGITVQVERTGSERIFQRVAQERANNIFAVDVLDGSDQALFVTWKKQGILEPYIPAELLKWPAAQRDPDGTFASVRFTLMPIAYNTNLVKPEDAPKASPICSIQNGPARSSRRIRATAAAS